MFNQHRIYRLFQLINYLKAQPAKSIPNIVNFLNTSERTVYRYVDLLKDLGFSVEKDPNNKLFIATAGEVDRIPFTPQEADYLNKLIMSAGKSSQLAQSVLNKVRQSSELEVAADSVFKAHLAQHVEKISMAIVEGKQLLIKGYSSASSQSITDRLVEPVCFTDNYDSVSAFEVSTQLNKYFNIERMAGVEVLDTPMAHEALHAFHKPDVFGFQGDNMDKEIELRLSMRAYLVIKEEYPMSSLFLQEEAKANTYIFKTQVQSFKAPGRFVMGFVHEIEVLGSTEFIAYMENVVKEKAWAVLGIFHQ